MSIDNLKGFDRTNVLKRAHSKQKKALIWLFNFGLIDALVASIIWNLSLKSAQNTLTKYVKNGLLTRSHKTDNPFGVYYLTKKGLDYIYPLLPNWLAEFKAPRLRNRGNHQNATHDLLTMIYCIQYIQKNRKEGGAYFKIYSERLIRVGRKNGDFWPESLGNSIPDAIINQLNKDGTTQVLALETQQQSETVATRQNRIARYLHAQKENANFSELRVISTRPGIPKKYILKQKIKAEDWVFDYRRKKWGWELWKDFFVFVNDAGMATLRSGHNADDRRGHLQITTDVLPKEYENRYY